MFWSIPVIIHLHLLLSLGEAKMPERFEGETLEGYIYKRI